MDKLKLEKLKETFINNNFKFDYYNDIDNFNEDINLNIERSIPKNQSVGFGGSKTLEELRLYELLKSKGYKKIYWHWKGDNIKKSDTSDIFFTSSNAITLDGKLINFDGTGNRISSMFYGHKRVYVIVGINKITRDYSDAINRIKNIAAPKNAKRLKLDTPCVKTKRCIDCNVEDRICNIESVIHKAPKSIDIRIKLINKNLGY